ncbi:MAG: RAMP superfamily CRISPR-associated protein [Gammaproteobacteria bacterium]
MNLRLTLRLTLDADYHVGAGHGAGPTVDAALLRDYDQAPLLRGTALAGLLRDGLADLRELPPCRSVDASAWKGAVERLFGSPAARKRWAYSSARADQSGVLEQAGRWGAQDVMRVRVDPRTRRALPRALFSQEEGNARLTFTFTATCAHPTTQDEADAALLVAAARLVRHLGAARRRGRGACLIALDSAEGFPSRVSWTQAEALAAFKRHWLEGEPTTNQPGPAARQVLHLTAAPGGEGRLRFRLLARADEPVIVAQRSEAANAYESLLTLPGTSVLGALASLAARATGLPSDKEAPADFITLFARGGVRVTGLHPAQKLRAISLHPTIATPRDSFVCEANPKHPVVPFARREEQPDKCPQPGCTAELKAWAKAAPQVTLRPEPRPHQPPRREEAHITLNRATGRVLSGNLYEYIALEAGQWFVGELECANEACWQALQNWLGLAEGRAWQLRLGKGAQRGYGLLTCLLTRVEADAPLCWTLRPLARRVTAADAPLTLLLLSDTIITDHWGRYEDGFAEAWLAAWFWPEAGTTTGWLKPLGQYAAARNVDSFNAARRAPRWRDRAIVAGSAVGIEITSEGRAELVNDWRAAGGASSERVADELAALRWRLAKLEDDGIGLRTHEGFGRVAFNHPVYEPGADLAEGVALAEPDGFMRSTATGQLIDEAKFRRSWARKLAEREKKEREKFKEREPWEALQDEAFAPVARLLYLCRQRDAQFIHNELKKLEEGTRLSTYLWNKTLPERGKQAKLDAQALALISDLIAELERQGFAPGDARWAIGLELIAERLTELAQQTQPGKETR